MVDVQLLNRLRALAARKRWMIGLAVGARCRSISAALVAVEGSGLLSRVEVAAHRRVALAPELARCFRRLRVRREKSPASAALFAARLAEAQATLLDDFAADIAPVWDRVSAVAVDGPALWHRAGELAGCLHLCDAARLAEMTGQNVIDGFAARDLAADGRGWPLLPIPYWILLHDVQRTRVLVEAGRGARVTYLPASRDPSGAARVTCVRVAPSAETVERALAALPQMPRIEEIVICDQRPEGTLGEEVSARRRDTRVVTTSSLGIAAAALKSSAVGVLGLLNLDHTPASLCGATGARTPRVLGRLTPGSLVHWHHLVRELAAARPSVVALRSAI